MNDATPYQYFVSTHNLFPINEGLICFITPNIRDTEKTIRYTSNRPCSEKENLYSHGNYDQVSMSQMIELFRRCEISSDIGLIIGFHKRTCTGSFCKKNKCCSQNLKKIKSRRYTGAIRRILETAKHSAPQHATLTANQQNSTATQLRLVHRKYTRENIRIMV